MSVETLLAILKSKNLRFNHVANLNDPFESLPAEIDGSRVYRTQHGYLNMREWYLRGYGLSSFSAVHPCDPQSILLWSHYADHHRGAAIAIETDDFEKKVFRNSSRVRTRKSLMIVPGSFYRVRYCKKRMRFHEDNIQLWTGSNSRKRAENLKLLIRKSNAWSYEKEYRLFVKAQGGWNEESEKVDAKIYTKFGKQYSSVPEFYGSSGFYTFQQVNFPIRCIKQIYLGCNVWKSVVRLKLDDEDALLKRIRSRVRCEVVNVYVHKSDYRVSLTRTGWSPAWGSD